MFALKRFLAGVLIGSVLFTFAGCGSSEEQKPTGSVKTESKENVSSASKDGENKGSDKTTSSGGDLSKVQIVTEDYKPFNYKDTDSTVKGTSTDKVKAAISKLGTNIPINVYPWSRAYEMAKSEENVLIYSMGRNAERENIFKWIAPVADINVYLYVLADREDIKLSKLEDAKKFKIATMAEDFTEQGLKKAGFKDQLISSPRQVQSIRQLFEKKADLWVATADGDTLKKMCADEGSDSSKLKVALTVEDLKTQLWIAASNKTSDEVVNKFKSVMDAK